MISFIVPAHNEERWIGDCLSSSRDAAESLGEPYELIVVDDASTDATAQIAQRHSARIIRVEHRHISRTRNAGAGVAQGEFLFFVDADTRANEQVVRAALQALRSGAVGGGCVPEFDRPLPRWGGIIYRVCVRVARLIRLVGGCFLFCSREAFNASGGFSERLYAGEEIAFIQALKRFGRFTIPQPTVITSGRKLDVMGPWEILFLLLAIAIRGPHHRKRSGLDFLYGERAQACKELRRSEQNGPAPGAELV